MLSGCAARARSIARSKSGGYTFVDAVFQLLLLIVVAHLIAAILFVASRAYAGTASSPETEWALFEAEVEELFRKADAARVHFTGRAVELRIKEERILLQMYYYKGLDVAMIRKRVNQSGHEPLLLDVTSAAFRQEGSGVQMEVEFADGRKEKRIFYTGGAAR